MEHWGRASDHARETEKNGGGDARDGRSLPLPDPPCARIAAAIATAPAIATAASIHREARSAFRGSFRTVIENLLDRQFEQAGEAERQRQ